ncbi:4'-phosphopantetheinyl transferase [Georgenia soli]|uniref:4'-phosphopantetheinyl transferase n=1 Tax=Georgenia soli TaxID=638953 RepID=A0A2A9EIW4_9MICO|nr:4-phosphopantetheinyl transferase [Georgenia soli]PFG38190.1 4'-phosphopantetheinyl transferase [Georgenia soli]
MAVEVWWSSLAAADVELLAVLDATERARVRSLERPADRGRSLVGAALLRVAAAAHLGAEPDQVVVDRTCSECGRPHGAPRIVGPGGPVPWVSVSHSGVLVVVALSPHGPVGVDVQRVSDLPDAGADAHAAFEWVRREAVVKARAGARTGAPVPGRPDLRPAAEEDEVTTELEPPVTGYAAALITLGRPGAEHTSRHWP